MNSPRRLLGVVLTVFFILSALVVPVHAATIPTVVKYSLPSGSNPIDPQANSTDVFYGSYSNGTVFDVKIATGAV